MCSDHQTVAFQLLFADDTMKHEPTLPCMGTPLVFLLFILWSHGGMLKVRISGFVMLYFIPGQHIL